MNGVQKAIKEAGGQTKLANQLGISQQAISIWKRQGFVPISRIVEIETQYGVPRSELVSQEIVDIVDPLREWK
jgi:DNA-binding transcriptional regulator YdaS (Cro superfamily)